MATVDTLIDNFDDNSLDTGKWTATTVTGSTLSETGGEIAITLPASPNTGYSFIESSALDLTSSSAYVQMTTRPAATSGTEQAIQLRLDSSNYLGFRLYPTQLEMSYVVGGSSFATTISRDDRTHVWFRIREFNGFVYWETSGDKSSWTLQRRELAQFNISLVKVRLHAGTWQTVASPGTASFDNFNSDATPLVNTAEGQPDGTTLTAANSGGGSGDSFATVTVTGSLAVTYSTDMSMYGTQCYKVVPSSSTALYIRPSTSGAYCGSCQLYIYLPTYADNNQQFVAIYSAGGYYLATLNVNQSGSIRVNNRAGTNLHASAASTMPTSQWVRIDVAVMAGSGTTDGRIVAQASTMNSFTPFWSFDSGYTTNTGTDTIAEYRIGKLDTTPNIALFYLDQLAWRSGMIAFIGPPTTTASSAWLTA